MDTSETRLRALLEQTERERDDLAATLETRNAEHALAMQELAVLRAQQAPLVACVDALRAAARAAGWRDADATGETLVAWVRRGEREACAAACERIERGAAEALDDVGFDSARVYIGRRDAAGDCARVIRGREGGE